jgi:hypothetical protein
MKNPSANVGNMTTPGIVQLRMPIPTVESKPDQGQGIRKTGSIDIASIVNFNKTGTTVTPKNGEIKIFGENPSIVVGSRSQPPANAWERYKWNPLPAARREVHPPSQAE